jgi:hypothetical protein
MIDFLKLGSGQRRKPKSVLGLSFDGTRVEGTVFRLTNGALELGPTLSFTLPAGAETADPVATGRALREQLDAAGIRERYCVVTVPCAGLLVTQTELPDLPEADAASLLQLEAERGFHSDITGLRVADSRCVLPNGGRFVTLAALPLARSAAFDPILAAAKLKPVGYSPAITELQAPGTKELEGVAAILLTPGSSQAAFQITAAGGIAALRSIEGVLEITPEATTARPEPVARELRITLGQLPEALEGRVRKIRVFGPRDLAEALAAGLRSRLASGGFSVEAVLTPDAGSTLPSNAPFTPSAAAAVRFLSGSPARLEFLPPRPSALEQFLAKHTSGRLRTTWVIAGAVTAVVVLAFLIQQIQLSLLESRWSKMSAKVRQLELTQQQIRQFRPWASESFRSLQILQAMSLAFPESGTVTAKLIEIRESGEVVCTGTATDSASILQMMDRLNASPGVTGLHRDQIRGKAPLQFNFSFRWNGGSKP